VLRGDVVKQQVVFEVEEVSKAVFQMDFEGLFVLEQLVETFVEAFVCDSSRVDTCAPCRSSSPSSAAGT